MFLFRKANPGQIQKAEELFKAGIELKNKGDFLESKKYLEQALDLQPNSEVIKLKLWQVEKACEKVGNSNLKLS